MGHWTCGVYTHNAHMHTGDQCVHWCICRHQCPRSPHSGLEKWLWFHNPLSLQCYSSDVNRVQIHSIPKPFIITVITIVLIITATILGAPITSAVWLQIACVYMTASIMYKVETLESLLLYLLHWHHQTKYGSSRSALTVTFRTLNHIFWWTFMVSLAWNVQFLPHSFKPTV